MSRTASTATVLVGLLLLIGAPVAWLLGRGPDRVGTIDAPPPAAGAPTTAPGPAATAPATTDPLAALRPDAVAVPAAVRIPAIGVDARVVSVGTEPDGEMEIPTDVTTVGWYRWGPTPGAPGSAVIAGHVDSRTQGRGAFFDLRRLDIGDEIAVTYDDGTSRVFAVTGREVVDKDVIPLADVFTRDGAPRLTLITCGGDFDGRTRSYDANVVVVAAPVGAR